MIGILVGLLGLEPRLFWTKTRRVASYTIDQLYLRMQIYNKVWFAQKKARK
jgi:hypothetical protein